MYIKLTDGVESGEPEDARRLSLDLCRSKQAGRLWGINLNDERDQMGATRSKVDPCRYEWNHTVHGRVFILVYVEDLIVAGESFSALEAIKSGVPSKFEVRGFGEVEDFIGMNVMRKKGAKKFTLSNPSHVIALLPEFGMDTCTPNKTAIASGVQLTKTGDNVLPENNRYAELVGSLLYLSTTTRPDIFCRGRALALHVMP